MRISDWISDVCSSDLGGAGAEGGNADFAEAIGEARDEGGFGADDDEVDRVRLYESDQAGDVVGGNAHAFGVRLDPRIARCGIELGARSEEHTSELQSLMRISYAVFCLKKKT